MKTKLLILMGIVCSVAFSFEFGNKEQICKSMCDRKVKEALESQSFKQDSKNTNNLADIEIVDIPNKNARKAFEDSLFTKSEDSKTFKTNNQAICEAKIFQTLKGVKGIYFDDSVIKANSNGVIDDIKGSKYDLVSLGFRDTEQEDLSLYATLSSDYEFSPSYDYGKTISNFGFEIGKYTDMSYQILQKFYTNNLSKHPISQQTKLDISKFPKNKYYRVGSVDYYRDSDGYSKYDKFGTCKDKKLYNDYCIFIYDIPKKEVSKISFFAITYYPIKSQIIKKEIPYSPNLLAAQEETGIKFVGTYTLRMIENKPLWIRINSDISFVALTRFYALKYDDNLQPKEIVLLAEQPLYQGVECNSSSPFISYIFLDTDILGN